MGTFFGREEVCTHAQIEAGEVENCVWEENVINSLDYRGGALWYPAVDRLDEMLNIIWVMGLIWPVWVPTLLYTCFVDGKPVKDENDRKRRKFCKMVFPIMYVISICALFVLLGWNFAAKVQNISFGSFSISLMIFSVNLPIRVPTANFVAALSSLLLGIGRLSVLFSKLSLGIVRCASAGKMASAAVKVAQQTADNATKVVPSKAVDNGASDQTVAAMIEEKGVAAIKKEAEDRVVKASIEKADEFWKEDNIDKKAPKGDADAEA